VAPAAGLRCPARSGRRRRELIIQVAPEVTFALAGYQSETVSVRSEEGSVFSSPKLTPNPVHMALHTIPAVPAKKKIRKRPAVASAAGRARTSGASASAAPPLTFAR
jgi:hypothetical protein